MRRPDRPAGFARYNLIGSFASAAGALLLVLPGALTPRSIPGLPPAPHPWIGLLYVLLAGATVFAYWDLSEEAEPRASMEPTAPRTIDPARRSAVRALTALFSVDAFAGGMVINPLLTAYFVLAWRQSSESVGAILFVVGVVSGLSFLVATRLADRFGLLPTMVFTHLPSNVLLVLVPFMPTFGLALAVLVARSALSQMDVPTRQAFTMDLVPDPERATVAGTLAGARSVAQSVGPFPALLLQASGALAAPFVIAGGLKSAYDGVLWQRFRGERGVDDAI